MRHNFAIKCSSFKDYIQVKLQVETLGYTYDHKFCKFEKEKLYTCDCLYFGDNFNSRTTPNAFSFSNASGDPIVFEYPKQKDEAMRFAQDNLGTPMRLTLKQLVEIAARQYFIPVTSIQVIP